MAGITRLSLGAKFSSSIRFSVGSLVCWTRVYVSLVGNRIGGVRRWGGSFFQWWCTDTRRAFMTPTGATGMKMKRESLLLSIPEKGILEKLQIPLKRAFYDFFFCENLLYPSIDISRSNNIILFYLKSNIVEEIWIYLSLDLIFL